MKNPKIGVVGSGTMGSGIAYLAATHGHEVIVFDTSSLALQNARQNNATFLRKALEKGKITQSDYNTIESCLHYTQNISQLFDCGLVIEAIVEDLAIKKQVFAQLSSICEKAILATNTSSLSVTSIASACPDPSRVIGIHFFNPAPLMPLVEIVPAIQTSYQVCEEAKALISSWDKTIVQAKDTPGFIVNRIARPFYGEAIRIYEEGIADIATIDWAMKSLAGFKMGPFELMDFIGHDVNYAVTETVFREFFYDPRYKPSFSQKRLVEAGFLGRKTGRGFYNYSQPLPQPSENQSLGQYIVNRIVSMLINEAAEAVYLGIASPHDIDVAMVKGTSYPKGLLKWADEIGIDLVLSRLEKLQADYGEDRYRPSFLLKKMAQKKESFYPKNLQ